MGCNSCRVWFALFALLVAVWMGCGKSEPSKPAAKPGPDAVVVHDHGAGGGAHRHDPHDMPIAEADVKRPADYRDAVARIKDYRTNIETAAASDVPGRAHRGLDELDIVLKWLPGIARDSNVPKGQWETINTGCQRLRELFEKVHANIDNQRNPDFAGVAKEVDETIGRLEAAAGAK